MLEKEPSSINDLGDDELVMMSKQLAHDQNRGMESIMDDQEGRGETYFAANAKLNDSAMVEYGLKKGNAMVRK